MQNLLAYYTEAGGKKPRLLLHDDTYGRDMISMIARYGRGLPADLLPVSMHATGRAGHDMMVAAIALGYEQVMLLLDPQKAAENAPLETEAALARALLAGVGASADNRIILIDDTDPDHVAERFYNSPVNATSKPAPFLSLIHISEPTRPY